MVSETRSYLLEAQSVSRGVGIMGTFLIMLMVIPAMGNWLYSPADSILYFQYDLIDQGGYVTLHFRDGGHRVDRAQGMIQWPALTFDDIPGHVFGFAWAQDSLWRSNDYGDTWAELYGVASGGWSGAESGNHPGECSMRRDYAWNQQWLFRTQDSWQTYDSSQVNMRVDQQGDSIREATPTFQTGLVYGADHDSVMWISSDFGQTWARGSKPAVRWPFFYLPGAAGELWWTGVDTIYVSLDTGRTVTCAWTWHGRLPDRPNGYPWTVGVIPTNLPGEVYIVGSEKSFR
jgi:hypothetical protein